MKKTEGKVFELEEPEIDPRDILQLNDVECEGMSPDRAEAEVAQSTIHTNAQAARTFARGTYGATDWTESVAALKDKVAKVQTGDLSGMEAMLTSQATTLDSIFTEMARRAAMNMGEYPKAADLYLRLALKAQSQCRTTVEALAEIKVPRHVAFVRQANIAHGPQQINNGAGESLAHGEYLIPSNELSGVGHELLPDTRTSALEGRIDTPMEAVGAIHRTSDCGR
jgi:hypothetical protein